MNDALRGLWRLTRATSIVVGLAVMVGLVAGVVSLAVAAPPPGGGPVSQAVLKGVTNTASAVTTLINSGTGPALSLQAQPGNAPLAVNSETKVDYLNSDQLDDKSANDLSRVAVMNTADTTPIPVNYVGEVTYGQELSITAPAEGVVRVNGNVTVLNQGCTSECTFVAFVRHINTGAYSFPQFEDALNTFGNAGLDAVFPVKEGVNTFDIRLTRHSEIGELDGWWGALTAEYTPYDSTGGTNTLSASRSAAVSEGPIDKELPKR